MGSVELLFVGTTVVTGVVLTFNPVWLFYLLLFFISYFAVLFFIETITKSGDNAKKITYRTEIFADVIVYLLNYFKATKRRLNSSVIEERDDYCGETPSVEKELETFAKNITNDYIKIWYTTVSENTEFPNECERAFQELFRKAFVDHFSKLETSKILSVILDNLRNTLAEDFNSLDLDVERDYGDVFVNELLDFLQPPSLEHVSKRKSLGLNNQEDPIYIIIRELLVDGALLPLVSIVTNPLWLNTVIIKLFSDVSTTRNETTGNHVASDEPISVADIEIKRQNSLQASLAPEIEKVTNNLFTRSKSAVFDRNLLIVPSLNSSPSSSASEPDILCETSHPVPEGDEISDLKIFTNLKIPKTQEVTVANEQFTVYCIEYDALFEEVNGKNSLNSGTEVISNSSWVQKKVPVKRRFREFTALQSRLENNVRLKHFLKGAKKPSELKRETQNLLDIAFGHFKLDKKTIEYRRNVLEKYLNFLCSQNPIAHSVEFQQFLGYGSDSRYAYVKSAQSILMPLRLDKVLTKSVKGAINLIKVAMPNEPQDGVFAPSTNDDKICRKSTSRSVRLTFGENFKLDHSLNEIDSERLFNVNRELIESQEGFNGIKNSDPSLLGPRSQGDGCEQADEYEGRVSNSIRMLCEEIPIGSNVIDILACILWNKTIVNSQVSVVLKVLFGQVFERFSEKLLSTYVTKENVILLTHLLHEAIWDSDESSSNQLSESTPQLVVQTMYSSISQSLPFESKLQKVYKSILYKFVDCFQVQQKNKLFVYSVLRQLFLKVY